MIKLDFNETNNEISQILDSNKPASILRIDNTMGYVLHTLNKKEEPVDHIFSPESLLQGGIYPIDKDYYKQVIVPYVQNAMVSSDLLGFVDISGEIFKGDYVNKFGTEKKMFDSFLVMDPGALFGYSPQYEKPEVLWTEKLKDKKVLVISTHVETIKKQWDNIENIWGDRKDQIAPFKLVDVIRSPYHPWMDERQPPNCKHFLESVNYNKELIDTYDYDVLLAGCSTSAPMYVDHAKKNGKVGIQTGGVLQIFFGIIGYRWTQGEYTPWKDMYNEHWIKPLKEDEAQNRIQHRHLETNFAYW